MDQLPRLGKREVICLLLFTCNYVVFVWRGFLFLLLLGMGYVILLWHSLSLKYNYLASLSIQYMLKATKTKADQTLKAILAKKLKPRHIHGTAGTHRRLNSGT